MTSSQHQNSHNLMFTRLVNFKVISSHHLQHNINNPCNPHQLFWLSRHIQALKILPFESNPRNLSNALNKNAFGHTDQRL